jgi:hypothetical protein
MSGSEHLTVWIAEDCPPYEQSTLLGVCVTEELARELAAREPYQDFIAVYEQDVLTELPPDDELHDPPPNHPVHRNPRAPGR